MKKISKVVESAVNQTLNKEEMIKCLQRSGYLLEGRIVKCLDELNLFIEPNASLLDERTGVSREIDIVAETYRSERDYKNNTSVKTTFAIEAINNLYPIVLLTPKKWSPLADIEEVLHHKFTPAVEWDKHPFLQECEPLEIFSTVEWSFFSQYCAFTRKKQSDELMVLHPEDLHTSIRKVVEFTLHSKDVDYDWMDKRLDHYWRIFMWRALIVVQNELCIVSESKKYSGGMDILRVDQAKLAYNFHFKNTPRTVVVDVVTEVALPKFIKQVLQLEEQTEKKLDEIRSKERAALANKTLPLV